MGTSECNFCCLSSLSVGSFTTLTTLSYHTLTEVQWYAGNSGIANHQFHDTSESYTYVMCIHVSGLGGFSIYARQPLVRKCAARPACAWTCMHTQPAIACIVFLLFRSFMCRYII